VAATSRDLPALVRSGQFREDLFYRLHVLPVKVPALRERVQDIPALVEVLLEDVCARNGQVQPELSHEAMALLMGQGWRGNVRELRNVLEQLMVRSESALVDVGLVRAVLSDAGVDQIAPPAPSPSLPLSSVPVALATEPLWMQVAALERQAVQAALQATQGNKVAAAKLLGISRAKLYQSLSSSV
jgi:DNA-binding NtrC family response regulator